MTDPSNNVGFLGPAYNYVQHIRSPTDMGLEVSGDMWKFGNDVAIIGDYIAVLIAGESRANLYPERPLGNSFFLPTIAKCTAANGDNSGNQVQRSLYINNISTGNVPLLSGLAGEDFTSFRGLVPGIAQNLEVLNPVALAQELFEGGSPPCLHVELPTIDNSGNVIDASGYLTIVDLQNMDPCSVAIAGGKWKSWSKPEGVPCGTDDLLTGDCSCKTTFQNMFPNNPYKKNIFTEENLTEIYIIILGILGLFLLLKVLHKIK